MKPKSILKILLKAVIIPLVAMFLLNKWNLCDFITFIPEDYRFEAGLTVYMAVLEAVVGFTEYFYEKSQAEIKCIFYSDEKRENSHSRATVTMTQKSMGTAYAWCHIILDGDWKLIKKNSIKIAVPEWFSVQLDESGYFTQENNQVVCKFDKMLAASDNGKTIHVESRVKLSFIRTNENILSMDVDPVITSKKSIDFETNGLTVQNMG